MRIAVRFIDTMLRQKQQLFEFCQDPEIIFRLQIKPAPHAVNCSAVTISKGDPILVLHIWNERMPRMPSAGADMEWAFLASRRIIHSFKAIAQWMQTDLRAAEVRAVHGASALFSFSNHKGGLHMIQRLGFTVLPYQRPLGRFGAFWENLFSWGLMWTFNKASLQSHPFLRLQRTEIWIAREDFLCRYGLTLLRFLSC
jgi:hypothetical protein